MSEPTQGAMPRSRRALLAAAAGAAAAAAATLVVPASALAGDPNDVVKDQDNATTALTSISQGTAGGDAFQANGNGDGAGLIGTTDTTLQAGVVGLAGDVTGSAYDTVSAEFPLDSGVYGFAAQSSISSGVFGEGPTGVYGMGDYGVYADGASVGIFASAYPSGTAVHAHAGTGVPPASASNVALMGSVTSNNQAGVLAHGRVMFPTRSGRVKFNAGQSSKAVPVSGMTSGNFAYAVLNSSRSGVYVRAVVPATGKITIYLNKAPSSSTWVAWLVLG